MFCRARAQPPSSQASPVQELLLPAKRLASWGLPSAVLTGVQRVGTLALVLGSAEMFWGPLEACRIDQRGLEEVGAAAHALLGRTARA
jgi:hypothetical protein